MFFTVYYFNDSYNKIYLNIRKYIYSTMIYEMYYRLFKIINFIFLYKNLNCFIDV